MRRTWLIFSQAVTVAVAVLFVVATLKPEWLPRRADGAGTVTVLPSLPSLSSPAEPAALPAGATVFSYSAAARRATPAVVSITARKAPPRQAQSNDPWFRFFFGDGAQQQPQVGLGSGVVVTPDGYLLTNNHVIEGADDIEVQLADGRTATAKLVGTDPETDVAVLKIELDKLPAIAFGNTDNLQVGDVVLAIGNPFGLNQTVTSGIISAVSRSAGGVNDSNFFIQTDAAINPGNSGGALVSLDGRLIGINTAIYSQTGGSVGIGFATPSNIVARMVTLGEAGGKIVRPWLGINMQRVTADLAAGFGLARPAGLVVKEVFPDGPGAKAGLRRNDVIVALRDMPIDDEASLRFRLATLNVDSTVPVKVIRGGKEVVVSLTLAAPPENPPREKTLLDGRQPLAGASVVNMSPAMADELNLVEWRNGVMVVEIKPGAYAGRFTRPGDMIVSINGQEVKSVADLKKQIAAGVASITISRDGMTNTVQFR